MTELIPGEAMATIQNNYLADNGAELVDDLERVGYVMQPKARVEAAEALVRDLVDAGYMSSGIAQQAKAWVEANK